jgi:hypothetical protein
MPHWATFFLVTVLCFSASLFAAVDPDDVEVSVITMGPGPLVYERFGHIAIRIRNEKTGQDFLYDWGNFDFEEPNFIGKFVKGSLLYSMDSKPTDRWLAFYQLQQDRSVTEQVLNLDATQKQKLFGLLIANEENPKYLYDYYLDNCSTRVRDLLDATLGGQVAPQWSGLTPNSFRWHTRRLLDVGIENQILSMLIDFSAGPRVDEPLTQWQASFVPMELSKLLEKTSANRSDGTTLPLVRERRILNDSKLPGNAEPTTARSPVRWALAIGLLLAGTTAGCARLFRIGFWFFAGIWSAFAVFGTVFFLVVICFTRHWIVDWNANFLQFSPISAGMLAGVLVPRWRQGMQHLPAIAVGLSVIGLLITISHVTIQQAAPAIGLALPMHLAVMFGWKARVRVNSADTPAQMSIA